MICMRLCKLLFIDRQASSDSMKGYVWKVLRSRCRKKLERFRGENAGQDVASITCLLVLSSRFHKEHEIPYRRNRQKDVKCLEERNASSFCVRLLGPRWTHKGVKGRSVSVKTFLHQVLRLLLSRMQEILQIFCFEISKILTRSIHLPLHNRLTTVNGNVLTIATHVGLKFFNSVKKISFVKTFGETKYATCV